MDTLENDAESSNFIRSLIKHDLATGKHRAVVTRFPPEPNGYLHIGHAKSICLNFGLALEFGGRCHLRFDDTNPLREDPEYVASIQADVRWLGFDWDAHLHNASDYFQQMYDWAVQLVNGGQAYVCSLSEDDIRAYRGTVTEPGRPSPWRERPVDESLDLLARMADGHFPDGAHTLRAKIDMAHPNMKMRDPLIYRIRNVPHHAAGDRWHIYPMYDYAHCLSDAIEGITHSLCTLEFENNRELYDWFLDAVGTDCHPQQIEFARLVISGTVMSKRRLLRLVKEGHVAGWDDPRMPTIAGLRRRGYTPASLRAFAERIGVAKAHSTVDPTLLENAIRDDLSPEVERVMCVLRPLELVIDNWPEGRVEQIDAPLYPHDVPKQGSRALPFTGVLAIERDDFAEDPPSGWRRLAPGREVRLRYAYVVRCTSVERDADGEIARVHCTYDPQTGAGATPDGRKVKGIVHWVSKEQARPVEVRLYDRLFTVEHPDAVEDFPAAINPASLEVVRGLLEPWVQAAPGSRFQFERQGYFFVDPADSRPDAPVFNRIVPLKDSWAKAAEERPVQPIRAPEAAQPTARRRSSDELRAGLAPDEAARFDRYLALELPADDAELLAADAVLGRVFEDALAAHHAPVAVANWIVNELRRLAKDVAGLPMTGAELGRLVALIDAGTISTAIAKTVLEEMVREGGDPGVIVGRRGLVQVSDEAELLPIIDGVLAENAAKVAEYRGGREGLLGFFVGQVMRRTGGKANPQLLQDLLKRRLAA